MAARIRLYDVEPLVDRPTLPDWASEYGTEEVPHVGDEVKVVDAPGSPNIGRTHYWRVIRRTHEPSPHRTDPLYHLGVRFIS